MSDKISKYVPQGLALIADNIRSSQNILGLSKNEKAKWAKDIIFSKNKETLFFAGCGYQYSSVLESLMSVIQSADETISSDFVMNIANLQKKLGINSVELYRNLMNRESYEAKPLQDAVRVLNYLGIEIGYLGENEPCCGGPLYYSGFRDDFGKNAIQVQKIFKDHGVRRIISIVPSCTHTLKTLMTTYLSDSKVEVMHFLQIVVNEMGEKPFRFPEKVKVVFHDPCQLGRYLKVVNEPRQILKSIEGIELVEPDWSKGEWATCCGGGGGMELVFPSLCKMLAMQRVEELLKTGAEVIVTQCPGCILQLREGLKALKIANIKVLDMAEILAMSMVS
jgi:heterodisulfide reductase subunit B